MAVPAFRSTPSLAVFAPWLAVLAWPESGVAQERRDPATVLLAGVPGRGLEVPRVATRDPFRSVQARLRRR